MDLMGLDMEQGHALSIVVLEAGTPPSACG